MLSVLPVATLGVISALASELASAQPAHGKRLPSLFIGHGSPMNAIEDNEFSRFLRVWAAGFPRPTAILMVSAHWLTQGYTAVSVAERPETIYDFGGFPQALFNVRYPAPGLPSHARLAASTVSLTKVATTTQWGLDHGAWTVLHHLYPRADVPVFQLSIDYDKPAHYHHALGRELAALREKGVLIVGSGNVVHNLRATDRTPGLNPRSSRPWAQAFDDAVAEALAGRNDGALMSYWSLAGKAASVAVETPDHYFPFLYALGASDTLSEPAASVFQGFQSGTISMRCVQFG